MTLKEGLEIIGKDETLYCYKFPELVGHVIHGGMVGKWPTVTHSAMSARYSDGGFTLNEVLSTDWQVETLTEDGE